MEIRLNKLISDSGVCSRREADRFIETGRVTVNGQPATAGMKVTGGDNVMLDGMEIEVREYGKTGSGKIAKGQAAHLIFGEETPKAPVSRKRRTPAAPAASSEGGKTGAPKREKYGKYNKYAAARKAAKAGLSSPFGDKSPEERQKEKILKEASQPKFGKSLSKGAIAQRIAAAPKSAALRKTSKNNPINKAKRAAKRNNPSDPAK